MKIHSKFRDYYDYLARVYGEDPMINWERQMLTTERFDDPVEDDRRYRDIDPHDFVPWYRSTPWTEQWDQRIVIVAGRRFLVYRRPARELARLRLALDEPWTALSADAEILAAIAGKDWRGRQRTLKADRVAAYLGEYSDRAMELCVKHQSPVLWLSILRRGVQVHAGSPRLGDITHFAAGYPAEQIYQDISDFWLNRAAGSPDSDPPVELDNNTKIMYHGFDRTSFRPGLRR